jgi:hypothetical protein
MVVGHWPLATPTATPTQQPAALGPLPAPPALPCSEKRGLDDELHGRERVLEGLGRDLSRGLNNVKRLTHELKLDGQVGAGCAGWGLAGGLAWRGLGGWGWDTWSWPAVLHAGIQVSLSCCRQQSRSHSCGSL